MTGLAIEEWLPPLLAACDGKHTVDQLLARVDGNQRIQARNLFERLYGERVLIEGTAFEAHSAREFHPMICGDGVLAKRMTATVAGAGNLLRVLCQDRLDYAEVLAFHRAPGRG